MWLVATVLNSTVLNNEKLLKSFEQGRVLGDLKVKTI